MKTPTVPIQPHSLCDAIDSIMEFNELQNTKLRNSREDMDYKQIHSELAALQSERK